jgi:3D (Asp-Asp-Asp) domain-containing protein
MKWHGLIFVCLFVTFQILPEAAFASRLHTTSQLLLGIVTAYTSSPAAVTAGGIPAFDGVVACPRKYPLGTILKIQERIYECRDRTSLRYGDRFDIWKPSEPAARLFGKQRLLIVALIPPTLKSISRNARLWRY